MRFYWTDLESLLSLQYTEILKFEISIPQVETLGRPWYTNVAYRRKMARRYDVIVHDDGEKLDRL